VEYLGILTIGVRFQTKGNKFQVWQNKINGTTIPLFISTKQETKQKNSSVAQAVSIRL